MRLQKRDHGEEVVRAGVPLLAEHPHQALRALVELRPELLEPDGRVDIVA